MLYDIRARLITDYDPPAGAGRHVLRLMPATVPGVQRLVSGLVRLSPAPDERLDRHDFWGNATVEAAWRSDHGSLVAEVLARVERLALGPPLDLSPPVARLAFEVAGQRDLGPASPHHCTGLSARVPASPEIGAWARGVLADHRDVPTVLGVVRLLGAALHAEMTFDPGATTVETLPEAAFRARHGVCQDYAHILIAALRETGIPAGYVSGFLRTLPPPGLARLEGADAMHAWVRAWVGVDMGWIDYDPTNDVLVSADHVQVAVGRDYADVAPLRGVLRTSGGQVGRQAVDVVPVGEA
jgi:transglutaminase-like putative cysteine protease